MIERLLHIKIDHVEYPELQKAIMPYYTSKGVRLDVYVKDSSRVFNVEMQSTLFRSIGKRSRYYQSMMDADALMKGEDYTRLPESYILFVCKDDAFGEGLPKYTFRETCAENPCVDFADKTTKVVYNASAYEKESAPELKAFLNFVCNNSSGDPLTARIQNLVARVKQAEENKTEYLEMNIHEQDKFIAGREEGRAEGERIGEERGRLETARNLLSEGLGSLEQIAKVSGLELSVVEQLQAELQKAPASK